MKTTRIIGRGVMAVAVVAASILPGGCGSDALFLQDYGRDLLVAGLAVALLLNPPPATTDDAGAGQPVPGVDGAQGEQGPPGPPGTDGAAGVDGQDGADGPMGPQGTEGTAGETGATGPAGEQGPKGDTGPAGSTGATGSDGEDGQPGPEFFDIFIDDFFSAGESNDGELPVVVVSIDEPVLGGEADAIAYRMAIPPNYAAGNDVTMRIFFFRNGPFDGHCFVFQLDARRLQDGVSGAQCYGGDATDDPPCSDGTRWVRVDIDEAEIPSDEEDGLFLVLDIPINTAAGLGLPNDLAVRDFLAFELKTFAVDEILDSGTYQILGVEFFESAAGSAASDGVTVFTTAASVVCPGGCVGGGPDCNNNGEPDDCDIETGTSQDCNTNGIPDECDLCEVVEDQLSAVSRQGGNGGVGGVVFLSGDDADDLGHCHGTLCGGLYPAILSFAIDNSRSSGSGILAIGVDDSPGSIALAGLNSWNDPANGGPDASITIVNDPAEIRTIPFTPFAVLYIPSVSFHTSGGIGFEQLEALNTRQADVVSFVNEDRGGLIALTEALTLDPDMNEILYGWLPLPIQTQDALHTAVCPTTDLTDELAPSATCESLTHEFYHNIFTGPPGFLGLKVLAVSDDPETEGDVVLLGGVDVSITGQIALDPLDETGTVGSPHTVTATVIDSVPPNDPLEGIEVTFEVISGPNAGATGSDITDANGQATFTYTGSGGPGVDEIRATFVQPGTDITQQSNIAIVTWEALDCSLDCNHNGIPDECELVDNDCNTDLIPDDCQLEGNDCQPNGIPDDCDIANAENGDAVTRQGGELLFPLDNTYELVDFFGDGCTGNGCASGADQYNDDDSATLSLPFGFDLYGTTFNQLFVNNNGNLSFGAFFSTFTAEGFPVANFPMVAPFWGDVDTRPDLGDVWFKFEGNRLVVIWNNVGYYNRQGDKRNTIEVAISDGLDPAMGLGNNVCFSYGDMAWTTGGASGGQGGFGGVPATVGANAGNGDNFFQIGRFDHPGDDYDGPGGQADGVDYLDNRTLCFSVATDTFNINPIASNFPPGNTLQVTPLGGGTVDLELQFLSPEEGQTIGVEYTIIPGPGAGDSTGLDVIVTPGNVAIVQVTWNPDCSQAGTYDIEFTATDSFDPPGVTNVTLTIEVGCATGDCNENGIPDECEPDCNGNGIPDDCDGGCEDPTGACCVPEACLDGVTEAECLESQGFFFIPGATCDSGACDAD